jgi:putative effector of murein hydrolase LrgA (UPF0299 family)
MLLSLLIYTSTSLDSTFASFSSLTALLPFFIPLSISLVKKAAIIAAAPNPIAARYVVRNAET